MEMKNCFPAYAGLMLGESRSATDSKAPVVDCEIN